MIKNFLKKHFYILKVRNRFNAATQISQRQLYLWYRERLEKREEINLRETGFRVFSQYEEDGILLYIFAAIGMNVRTFIEIGSDDGINSNCANLALNFGWNGLFIDGNQKAIDRGRHFYGKYPHPWGPKPVFQCAKVGRENVNQLISENGLHGEIGLLSIDVDGNDYWIWDALEVVQPQVVVIETHIEFGLNNVVVPYDANYVYPGIHPLYHGASPVAMVRLASRKGYRLVGANELGFNFIFIRNGLAEDSIPEVEVETVLHHYSAKLAAMRFDEVKHLPFEEGR